jgi:catechol 2,3-dioxygenase-like lactoylglutathione lyase family enzyme
LSEIIGVHHFMLGVSNLDRSLAFYKSFGFKETYRGLAEGPEVGETVGVPGVSLDEAFLERDGVRLELIEYRPRHSDTPPHNDDVGSAHLCLQVRGMHGLYEQMRSDGVQFVSAPLRSGNVDFVYFRDPDGIMVELLEELGPAT